MRHLRCTNVYFSSTLSSLVGALVCTSTSSLSSASCVASFLVNLKPHLPKQVYEANNSLIHKIGTKIDNAAYLCCVFTAMFRISSGILPETLSEYDQCKMTTYKRQNKYS